MASNILLLASNYFLLTSQGLVGAGMNCRPLKGALRNPIACHMRKSGTSDAEVKILFRLKC